MTDAESAHSAPSSVAGSPRIALLLFAGFLIVYALLTTQGAQGGDVSEFIRLGSSPSGVAHPPGYPLYTLLCKLFGQLPFGTAAFRVSLTSAVAGAAGVAVLFLILIGIGCDRIPALVGSVWLGFSLPYWKVAGVAEVLSLHALLVLILVYLTAATLTPRWRAALLGLVGGLGIAHHHTIVFALPLCLVGLWRAWGDTAAAGQPRDLRNAAQLFGISLLGLTLGLTPYLTLFLPHKSGWSWTQIDSLDAFWRHVTRAQYGTFSLRGSGPSAHGRLSYLVWSLLTQARGLAYVGALAAIIGFVTLLATPRRRALGIGLLASWVGAGLVFPLLFHIPRDAIGQSIIERFLVMPMALLAVAAGVGVQSLWQHAAAQRRVVAVAGIAASLVLAPLNLEQANWRDRRQIGRFVASMLTDAPTGAVIFGQGDHLMHSVSVVQLQRPELNPSALYIDLNLLRIEHYYRWVKRRWPALPMPYHPRLTRISALLASAPRLKRAVCFVDSLPILTHVPHHARGTLLCLGRLALDAEHVLNMQRIAKRGLPPRPDPTIEPWGALVWPLYFRPLISLHRRLRAQGKHGRADYIARILVNNGFGRRR